MPTKKRRISHLPDNLPAQIDNPEETCPSIHTAERVFRDRPEVYHQCVQRLAVGASIRAMKKRTQSILAYDCHDPHLGGQGNLCNQGAHPRPPRGRCPAGNRKIDRSHGTGQDPALSHACCHGYPN